MLLVLPTIPFLLYTTFLSFSAFYSITVAVSDGGRRNREMKKEKGIDSRCRDPGSRVGYQVEVDVDGEFLTI